MKLKQLFIGVFAALILGGCASIESLHTSQTLLDEYRLVDEWGVEESQQKIATLEKIYRQYPTNENRLRLAVVLGFSKGHSSDTKRALNLFEKTVASAPNTSTGTLAGIFIELLNTRKDLSGTRWALRKERQKVGSLEEKLQALTSIEKSLHLRD